MRLLRARLALAAANVLLLAFLAFAGYRTFFTRLQPSEGGRVPSYDPTRLAIAAARPDAAFDSIASQIDRPPPEPKPVPPPPPPAQTLSLKLAAILHHPTKPELNMCIVDAGSEQLVVAVGDKWREYTCEAIERGEQEWRVRFVGPDKRSSAIALRPE